MINFRKAVMVGCGFVGSASVFALMQSGLFSEIAMIDADMDKAEGEAMDISHGIPFAKQIEKIIIPNSFEIYNNASSEQILLREKNNTMNNTLINCYALEKKKIIDKIVIE